MSVRTLIIEDDTAYARILERIAQDEGLEPFVAGSGEIGLEMAEHLNPMIVLCDIGLPGIDGIEVVRQLTARSSEMLSIIISGQATVENTVRAMKAGAFDILQKASDPMEIRLRLQRTLQTANLQRQIQYLRTREEEFGEIIGESNVMKAVRQRISEVATSPSASVLIVGDTGTGKELVARAVHRLSIRHSHPLVAINCAAIPETLMESVFFGHERGAFSGADRARAGLFETADGSSLFLDEIGELDLRLQAKLLRALEEKTIVRLGGTREIPVDVRLIAATNRDLESEVKNKRFREDLLYRINVFTIKVPPLRERGQDILLLAHHFMKRFAVQLGKRVTTIAPDTERILQTSDFPGNVRQLRNLVEQAVILMKSDTLESHAFGEDTGTGQTTEKHSTSPLTEEHNQSLAEKMNRIELARQQLDAQESSLIQEALQVAHGNKSAASQLLGISRFALGRRLGK